MAAKFRNLFRKRTKGGINPYAILRPKKATKVSASSFIKDTSDTTESDGVSNPIVNNFNSPTAADIPTDSSLPYIQNPYPVEIGIDPSPSYSRTNEGIQLKGQYEENVVLFDDININGITSHANYGENFNFLVKFEDDSLHTSTAFLKQLTSEYNSANPYNNKETVTVVEIDSRPILGSSDNDVFTISEKYAEVTINGTINTNKDILDHINWMVETGDTVRKIELLGSSTSYTPADMTEFNYPADLGFTHQEAAEEINEYVVYESR